MAEVPWPPDPAVAVSDYLVRASNVPRPHCLLAVEGPVSTGPIAGFVTFLGVRHPLKDGGIGVIENLYVEPRFRRQGIGTSLVDGALASLREEGLASFRANVFIDDRRGIKFWQQLGWNTYMRQFSLFDI